MPPEPFTPPPRVIACGALARELRAVLPRDVEVTYLPAPLHNDPDAIAPAVAEVLARTEPDRPVLVGYGDCGTGGGLDRLLEHHPTARRLPGAHCYAFLAGAGVVEALMDDEPGTFFLTDFLARHFDALVWRAYRLDRLPELRDLLFAGYTRVVHLAQGDDTEVARRAAAAADRLGLPLVRLDTGTAPLAREVAVGLGARPVGTGGP